MNEVCESCSRNVCCGDMSLSDDQIGGFYTPISLVIVVAKSIKRALLVCKLESLVMSFIK